MFQEHFPSYTHSPPIPLANFGLPLVIPGNLPDYPDKIHVPSYTQLPPTLPPAVMTTPKLSLPTQAATMPTNPTIQHILGAHIATSYELPMPPVYAIGSPTFMTQIMVRVLYKVDQYAEIEKDARLKEEELIASQLHIRERQ